MYTVFYFAKNTLHLVVDLLSAMYYRHFETLHLRLQLGPRDDCDIICLCVQCIWNARNRRPNCKRRHFTVIVGDNCEKVRSCAKSIGSFHENGNDFWYINEQYKTCIPYLCGKRILHLPIDFTLSFQLKSTYLTNVMVMVCLSRDQRRVPMDLLPDK